MIEHLHIHFNTSFSSLLSMNFHVLLMVGCMLLVAISSSILYVRKYELEHFHIHFNTYFSSSLSMNFHAYLIYGGV